MQSPVLINNFTGQFPTGPTRRVQLHLNRGKVHIYPTTEALLLHLDNNYPHDGTGSALSTHIPGSHRLGRKAVIWDIDSIGIYSLSAHRFRNYTTDIDQCSSNRYERSNLCCLPNSWKYFAACWLCEQHIKSP